MRVDNTLAQLSARISANQIDSTKTGQKQSQSIEPKESFAKVLEQQIQKNSALTFSKHAQLRMLQREMELTESDVTKLSDAVKAAEEKGVRDTLVLMKNMAFIVNVPSNLVVTAMKDGDLEGNVFTKIDGAVIV